MSPRFLCGALLVCALARSSAAHEDDAAPPTATPVPGATAPVLLERFAPVYPEAAREAGVGGTVGLELSVGIDGSVTEVKVVRSAGFGFDEAASTAARR